jgi:hypothetical protein
MGCRDAALAPLRAELKEAKIVLSGRLVNPMTAHGEEIEQDTTDLVIDQVPRWHPLLGLRLKIALPRYIPTAGLKTTRCIVLCDAFKGQIDPFRLLPDPHGELTQYVKDVMALPANDAVRCLCFFVAHLNHANENIARDAYLEVDRASSADLRAAAPALPANRIARWLETPNFPGYRLGLCACLLGHCGNDRHAALLERLAEDPKDDVARREIWIGYCMLRPREGRKKLAAVLSDPNQSFLARYDALRVLNYCREARPDEFDKKDLGRLISPTLEQDDFADLAIDTYRRWGCWDMSERVLALRGRPAYKVGVVHRAVLRFALCCTDNPAVGRFLAEERRTDAPLVADIEELLKLEQTPPGR